MSCPCGSGSEEAACCGRYLAGERAPTAVALMRSRYTAYARGAIDYLVATHDPATRNTIDATALATYARTMTWRSLEIVATERGGTADTTGIVEFVASGAQNGTPFQQRERSRFRRLDGAWVYVGGDLRAPEAPGRNDPCPCGSGKKYKRCHGA